MRIKNISALAVAGALLSGSSALAAQYVDNNSADVWLNVLNKYYDGQFDLTGYGYNPVTQQIDSAYVTFTLFDLLGKESYDITIEGDSAFTGGSFCGFIDLDSGITGTLKANLDVDGILNYTVSRDSGEFWLTNARLCADASNRVPDGGATVGLLGLGIVSLVVGAKRKMASVK